MLDDPKPLSARPGPKRPTRRFFVITNPNEEPVDPSTPPFYPPPPLPSTSRQHPDKPTPSPPQPSPINTDNLQQKYPQRYNPSDRTLSSPSTSTSSPAHESTPPPSTPGQIELAQGSDRDNCQNHLISRTDNFVKKITAPFSHVRRKSSGTNVPPMAGSSPLHHDQTPSPKTQKPNPCIGETRIFVTADSGVFKVVDITGARDAAFIRERIFADMQISDENQTHFSIYRTEVGSYAIGDALADELLFELCRDHGDSYASLKFMVSHTSAAVHESPLDSSYSQKFYTIPPPVVIPRSNGVYSPVRSQHRCGSPPRSLSSASERIPQESGGGYDASVSDDNADAAERDPNRATIKPGSYKTAQRIAPSPLQQSPSTIVDRGHTEIAPLRIERHHFPSIPPQPLSPGNPRFPFMEDNYTLPARRTPQATSSDAALERERVLEDSEAKLELAGQQWRVQQQQEAEERERQRTREREREREAQRRAQSKNRGTGSEHWTVVPSDIPHSDYKKERPTAHDGPRSPPSRRGQGYNEYSSRNAPSEGRGSRRTVGTPVPTNWTMPWIAAGGKTESKASPTSPSLTYRGNRSMGDLRAAAAKHPTPLQPGKRAPPPPPLPMTRPATSSTTQELVEPKGVQPVPRSFESRSNLISPSSSTTTRPLPVAGNSGMSSTSIPGSIGLISPSNEPCPRPCSAMGNTGTSPQSSSRFQPPINHTEPNNQARSPPSTLSPHSYRHNYDPGFSSLIPKIVPPTSNSEDRTTDSGYERGIGNSVLREPPSPATPSSPRYSASSETSPGGMASPVDGGSAESTLKGPQWYPQIGDFPGNSTVIQASSESTAMPPRRERPDIKPLPQRPTQASSHPVHPYATPTPLPLPPYPHPSSDVPQITTPSTASMSTSHTPKPIPQPPTPTTLPIPGPLKSIPSDDDSDSGSNAGGTLWAISDNTGSTAGTWQTTPQSDRRKSLPRLVMDPGVPQVQPLKQSGPTPLPPVPTFMPPEYPPAPRRPPKPQTKPPSSFSAHPNNRISVFNEDFRPPAEEMYERLGDFFPGHDLDEPVIEASSGGTSPTSAEAVQPFPTPDRRKHKKSIRVVANEHKRKLDRTSRIPSAQNANVNRKRSTKLWGSKVEEVTAEQFKSSASALSTPAESPSEPKPIFKWVRGELIGKGTYGKVYVALNATTGEMIAVKQVEIPRTENDKNDSRQVTVVEALKLESETLKDLDHQNVVQYLGFEETPRYLSIFLEYVPGGSIASTLRKHGRFSENVTKSFTSQILDGLDYLHSKGIIHRDLKADNILVEEFGHCKITDFGISKRTDDINMIGAYTSMQGSVFWMAPEVVNGQKKGYNSKIDIWSVGCVMFEMWTGERPWSGQEAVAVLLQLYQSKPGPPLPMNVPLSPQADDLRKRCFALDPDERPTAGELRQHPYLVLPSGWEFTGYS